MLQKSKATHITMFSVSGVETAEDELFFIAVAGYCSKNNNRELIVCYELACEEAELLGFSLCNEILPSDVNKTNEVICTPVSEFPDRYVPRHLELLNTGDLFSVFLNRVDLHKLVT